MRILSIWLLITPFANADLLKVGLGELDYPPFYFKENDRVNGVAVEIAEAVAKRAGHLLSYERVPWKRLQERLKLGSLDMVILYFKTPERAKDVIYTREPHIYENSFLVLPRNLKVDFKGKLSDLSEYDFFYVRGYSHGKEFDNSTVLKKHTVNNENELLFRITSGRPFIGVGNKPALLMYADQAGLQDQVYFLDPPFDRGANYMAFSKKRPDAKLLADQFSDAFEQYSLTAEYTELLTTYGFATD